MQLELMVTNQTIKRADKNRVVADSKNYLYAHFTFTDDWYGTKTAIFRNEDDDAYEQLIGDDGKCLVPYEVIKAGELSISCVCGSRVTANKAYVIVEESGYEEGETPATPTATVYEQIISKLDDLQTPDTAMSSSSKRAVQNKVIKSYVDTKSTYAESSANYYAKTYTDASVAVKQDKLNCNDGSLTINGKNISVNVEDNLDIESTKPVTSRAVKEAIDTKQGKLTTNSDYGLDLSNSGTLTLNYGSPFEEDDANKPVSAGDLGVVITDEIVPAIDELREQISTIPKFDIKIVTALPTHNISKTTIYLVRKSSTETSDVYAEWIYVDNKWESLGTTSVDLSNYYKKSETYSQGEVNTKLSSKANTSDIPTKTSQLTNDSGYLTEHQDISGKQDKLTAGDNITIENNVISAQGGGSDFTPLELSEEELTDATDLESGIYKTTSYGMLGVGASESQYLLLEKDAIINIYNEDDGHTLSYLDSTFGCGMIDNLSDTTYDWQKSYYSNSSGLLDLGFLGYGYNLKVQQVEFGTLSNPLDITNLVTSINGTKIIVNTSQSYKNVWICLGDSSNRLSIGTGGIIIFQKRSSYRYAFYLGSQCSGCAYWTGTTYPTLEDTTFTTYTDVEDMISSAIANVNELIGISETDTLSDGGTENE